MATGRILIIGSDGMFGGDMLNLLRPAHDIVGADIGEVDITSKDSVNEFLPSQHADIVINCAGYTNVDGCERDPDLAFRVNEQGAAHLAEACREYGVPLVHMSTDFVFDGTKETPYTEDDAPNPISKYAESKLAGEIRIRETLDNHLIVRTTWLYGFHDKSFVRFVLRMASGPGPVKVYSRQRACPTYTLDLAEGIIRILENNARGTYNLVNSGDCNRLEFVKEIFDIMQYDKSRIELMADPPPSWLAKRPERSPLSTEKYRCLTGTSLRTWQQALRDYLEKDAR